MQARAIFEAALQVAKKGIPVKPEVMIPLVGHVEELKRQKAIVLEAAAGGARQGRLGRRLPDRHHDRGPARRGDRRRDREGGRVLLVRHQRPHPDGLRPLAATTPASSCSTTRSTGCIEKDPFVTLDAAGVGLAGRDRRQEGPQREAEAEDRRLRRARRRPVVDPLLPQGGPRLRVLLALPGADRASRGGPGPARGEGERLVHLRGPYAPSGPGSFRWAGTRRTCPSSVPLSRLAVRFLPVRLKAPSRARCRAARQGAPWPGQATSYSSISVPVFG